jgi:hypothetical protein
MKSKSEIIKSIILNSNGSWEDIAEESYNAGYDAKEEVSWDEAFDEYSKDRGKTTHFVSWVKDNYTLIRKSK